MTIVQDENELGSIPKLQEEKMDKNMESQGIETTTMERPSCT